MERGGCGLCECSMGTLRGSQSGPSLGLCVFLDGVDELQVREAAVRVFQYAGSQAG